MHAHVYDQTPRKQKDLHSQTHITGRRMAPGRRWERPISRATGVSRGSAGVRQVFEKCAPHLGAVMATMVERYEHVSEAERATAYHTSRSHSSPLTSELVLLRSAAVGYDVRAVPEGWNGGSGASEAKFMQSANFQFRRNNLAVSEKMRGE